MDKAEAVEQMKQRTLLDPLTYYQNKPRENFKDPRTGQIWKTLGPTPTQKECWQGSQDFPFRLLTSGNQGAKTTHAMCEVAARARGLDPYLPWAGNDFAVRILVIVVSQRNADSTWGRRLLRECEIKGPAADQPLIPDYEIASIDWAKKKGGAPTKIELKNGSVIQFAWAGSHDMWERVQGDRIDFVYIDEGKSEGDLFTECANRLQVARSDERKPGGGSMLWTATGTVNAPDFIKFRKRCMDPENKEYGYYLIDPKENPAVNWEDRELINKHLSKEEYDVRVMGTATKADIYYIYRKQFSRERHTTSQEFEPGIRDNIFIFYDPAWGRTASECGIMFACITQENPDKLIIWKWISYRGDGIRQHVMDMARVLEGRYAAAIIVDPAIAKADPMTGDSTFDNFLTELDDHNVQTYDGVHFADNNVNAGIQECMMAFDDNRVLFMNMDEEEMETAVTQIEMYQSRAETKYFKAANIKKRDNEAPDCLRYGLMFNPIWVDYGPNMRRSLAAHLPGLLQGMIPDDVTDESDIPPGMRGVLEEIRGLENTTDPWLQTDDDLVREVEVY